MNQIDPFITIFAWNIERAATDDADRETLQVVEWEGKIGVFDAALLSTIPSIEPDDLVDWGHFRDGSGG